MMKYRGSIAAGVLFIVCLTWLLPAGPATNVWAQAPASAALGSPGNDPYSVRIPAPPLDGAIEWVNTERPLSLAEFRGRFVLLDFWTYCCINCMQILPDLKKLEKAFPNELVVIGVHSAKFEGERDSANIREAILRYEIEHPVVNDGRAAIWGRYTVRSWPTVVLIDPLGDVVWAAQGERTFEEMKAAIDRGLPFYQAKGVLRPAPRPALLTDHLSSDTPLRFPGKILADATNDRLFISDSNHNRIVVANLAGELQYVVGSGAIGREDGEFDQASFNHPQGMALVGETLYVADTENHLLRKVDLAARRVTTVAGTGEKGSAIFPGDEVAPAGPPRTMRSPRQTPLASPWAVWPHEDALFIAMAGPHQIWKMPLDEQVIELFAGNGREDIVDGRLQPRRPYQAGFASFAQPSGLASDGERLYVADSEGSTVRAITFAPPRRVETLVGLTGTLFDFGDIDGVGKRVRLQHPLDVTWSDGKLYLVDTYNNKVKVIDVERRRCETIAGSGAAGSADGDGQTATFNEPGGISAADGKLYVADTNSNAVRVVELTAPYRVTTLEITGLKAP